MKNWKAKEIKLVEWLNTKMLWVAVRMSRGLRGEAVEDVRWGPFSIELKTRKATPSQYMLDWLAQAKANCKGRIPIVLLHKDRMMWGEQVVMLDLAHFEKMIRGYFNLRTGPGRIKEELRGENPY